MDNKYIDSTISLKQLKDKLRMPYWDKIWYVAEAIRRKVSIEEIFKLTKIDPWFLNNIKDIVQLEAKIKSIGALQN